MNARTPGLGAGFLVLRASLLTLIALAMTGAAGIARGGPPPEIDPLAKPVAAFGLDLLRQPGLSEGNLCISPYSMSAALGMACSGASGETRKEMEQVLHYDQIGEVDGLYALMITKLNALSERNPAVEVAVADRLWGQIGFQFYDRYLEELQLDYGAGLETVDFRNDTETARETINAWVAEQTRDRIRDIVPPFFLDPYSTLVLTNAIYFRAQWLEQFQEAMTREQPFRLAAGDSVDVPLMHRTADYGYLENDDAQILELQYRDDHLSMLVWLPKERDGLAALEENLTADALTDEVRNIPKRRVEVWFPRFEFTASFELSGALQDLGMKTAFIPDVADFTRMAQDPDIFISEVLHKSFVSVDENGTEAAAATIVATKGFVRTDDSPPVFRADHPFLFAIRYRPTGTILFLGRVSDPSI